MRLAGKFQANQNPMWIPTNKAPSQRSLWHCQLNNARERGPAKKSSSSRPNERLAIDKLTVAVHNAN